MDNECSSTTFHALDINHDEEARVVINMEKSAASMRNSVTSTLEKKINRSDEKYVQIPSNDLFRPRLLQLGDSLNETKEHYASNDGMSVVPTTFSASLNQIKDQIVNVIRDNNRFSDYDFLIERQVKPEREDDHKGFIFLATSLSVALDFPTNSRPDDVICDVFLVLPHQPALVLTILGSNSEAYDPISYNTSVARGVCVSLGRFMDEGFKTAFGIVKNQDLGDGSLLKSRFEDIIRTSGKYVTYSSLKMNKTKYEKVLTAFWASISETKLVVKSQSDDNCLRFLTKDQCIVLVENINKEKVEVCSKPGTGSTLLMAEAARRLSHLGNTLFVCDKQGDSEKYRNMCSGVKTCVSEDLLGQDGIDPRVYTCVVEETSTGRRHTQGIENLKGIHWIHHSISDSDDDTDNKAAKRHIDKISEDMDFSAKRRRVSDEMTKLSLDSMEDSNVTLEKEKSVGVAGKMELEGTEWADPVYVDAIVDGRVITVMCSPMKLDRERVNPKHCSITDNNELINSPGESGTRPYRRYWGTSSTIPIHVKSATTTVLISQYWEVHAEIEPKDRSDNAQAKSSEAISPGPLFEFGVVEQSHADKRVWMCQGDRFWCFTLEGCKSHNRFCARVRNEIPLKKEVPCREENVTKTGKTSLKYGILVDVAQDMVAFIDVNNKIILGIGRTDFQETLLPTFNVTHIYKNKFDVKLKLVSGADIDITEKKKELISKCYQNLVSI